MVLRENVIPTMSLYNIIRVITDPEACYSDDPINVKHLNKNNLI